MIYSAVCRSSRAFTHISGIILGPIHVHSGRGKSSYIEAVRLVKR